MIIYYTLSNPRVANANRGGLLIDETLTVSSNEKEWIARKKYCLTWLSPVVLLEAHQKFITSLNYIVVKAVNPTEYTWVIQIKLFIGAFAV